jgi:molecular chaperone HscC
MPPVIGIDLGTSNSLCAVFDGERPRLIPNAHGEVLTPSIVGVNDKGQILVGATAKELRVTRPANCVWAFKRWMGTDRRVELVGHEFNAQELSAMVLTALKHDAEVALGEPVRHAVITVPAYFNDNQRNATKIAGELAGLRVVRLLNEPTAAALTYGFHDRDAERKLIVIDLGGGTFDVTAMDVFEGTLEIISTAGEGMLGGEDFTDRLVAWVLDRRGLNLETAEMRQPLLVARLRRECEMAKCRLSDYSEATIRVPDSAGQFAVDCLKLTLDRSEFQRIVDPIVKRLARPIGKAIRDSRLKPEDLQEVILVGGATRMWPVREFVQKYFGRVPVCTHNPDEVVALGAAVQAALIGDDTAVADMVMTDICPFTLGVEICKEFGQSYADGYFLPVVHRNTTIPVSREQIVHTIRPNQREVTLSIYQGDARKVKDNLLLGKLTVSGIPLGPSGQPVHVRFTYDLNGILEVEAFVGGTNKHFSTVLTHRANNLSKKEIDAAVRLMQTLKFYPRDDVRNQHLVLFAERVVGEVGTYQRSDIEMALDQFEQAMASGERVWFDEARQGLLKTLMAVGFPYDGGDDAVDDEEPNHGDDKR